MESGKFTIPGLMHVFQILILIFIISPESTLRSVIVQVRYCRFSISEREIYPLGNKYGDGIRIKIGLI